MTQFTEFVVGVMDQIDQSEKIIYCQGVVLYAKIFIVKALSNN